MFNVEDTREVSTSGDIDRPLCSRFTSLSISFNHPDPLNSEKSTTFGEDISLKVLILYHKSLDSYYAVKIITALF